MGINVTTLAGNHDIGYGNEADANLVGRFETAFGSTNVIREVHGHLLVILNSCVLDAARNRVHET